LFAAALKLTWPAPVPFEALVSESHPSLAFADHAHPAVVVIVTDPVPPAASTAWLVGLIENVHAAAAWFTVKVCPPMVIVPTRVTVVAFADTLKVTGPVPAPLEALVSESHPALTFAAQAHPAVVVSVTDPVPPAAATDWLAGLIENTQGAAACVTVKICPPIVIVPTRATVAGLEAAVNLTMPVPVPDVAPVIDNQGTLADAVQAQPEVVDMFTLPEAPVAATA
jgi:hypothetical protein